MSFTLQGPVTVAEKPEAGWSRLARFIEEAAAAYSAGPARVFLAGFSQGGIMALATLLTAPERVAGAIPMSGRLLPEVLPHAAAAEALRDKPALIAHGTADEKLGIHLARWAGEERARLPIARAYRELPMGHTITNESLNVVTSCLTATIDAAHP